MRDGLMTTFKVRHKRSVQKEALRANGYKNETNRASSFVIYCKKGLTEDGIVGEDVP